MVLIAHGRSGSCVLAQYMGGSTTGERGEKLFQELCNLWPPNSVSPDALRKVLCILSAMSHGLCRHDKVLRLIGWMCLGTPFRIGASGACKSAALCMLRDTYRARA